MEGRVANLEEEMTGIKTEIKELKEMFGEMMRLWKGKNSTQDGEKLVAADPRETNTSAAHGREEAEAQQKNGEGRNHVGGRPRGGRPPARTPEEVGKCVAVSIVQDTTREKWLEMLRNDPEVQQKVAHLLDQVDGSSAAPESTRPQWEVRDKLVYRGGKLSSMTSQQEWLADNFQQCVELITSAALLVCYSNYNTKTTAKPDTFSAKL
ncbi:hypothetical protein GUJ93_ZPchr0004g38864 [Zizania palustris]|uniref:Uncharacterized protein n=1 Tax=Zizania palustris TaxID=103762 RepID=A0A8J5SCL3_ZIZPA|nr:hypothetical protein GUJ93_ZPchr0004g38864 [Zizania palustris]